MDLLNDFYASCLNCGWEGSPADAPTHENDEHMVVYNPYFHPEPEMEVLDPENVDYGCGCT